MAELRIPARDTYCETQNFDDFYSNGNRYGGPCLLKFEWTETAEFPEMKANKLYHIPSRASVAYDACSIVMPHRYLDSGRDDPIVHELVHFLQHNTVDEDSRYIRFNGANYNDYLKQRVELEAHSVQVLYILRENPERCSMHLAEQERELVNHALSNLSDGCPLSDILPALLLCKERQLI
jgi:hypothetical protein